ncbi:MAG: GNAT family N-acetyltransferase [Acidimicrobiales bacterium]
MGDAVVRAAEPSDAPSVRSVYADAYTENRALGFPGSAENVSVGEVSDWIRSDSVWVAEVSGAIVGAVRLRRSDPNYPTLGRLAVVSRMKRNGVGTRLLDAAESAGRREGCAGIELTVAEKHPYLPRMYAARGYTVLGPRSPQHSLYNEIVMRKLFETDEH